MPIDIEEYPLFQDGFERGLERGLEQGLERGRDEGEVQTLVQILRHRFPELSREDEADVRSLDAGRRRLLTDVLLDISTLDGFRAWLHEDQ